MADNQTAPNLMFSHLGISVKELAPMEAFYGGLLGFTVTDRGQTAGMDIVFLSRDPLDHHQIVLATGRPETLPANTCNPIFGPCINQISFRMASLADLRDMYHRLKAAGYTDEQMLPGNHGVAWSIYVPDPEGNIVELFVDTEWYIDQPILEPLDFAKSDEEIVAITKSMCEAAPGYEPVQLWRARIAARMTPYRPAQPAA